MPRTIQYLSLTTTAVSCFPTLCLSLDVQHAYNRARWNSNHGPFLSLKKKPKDRRRERNNRQNFSLQEDATPKLTESPSRPMKDSVELLQLDCRIPLTGLCDGWMRVRKFGRRSSRAKHCRSVGRATERPTNRRILVVYVTIGRSISAALIRDFLTTGPSFGKMPQSGQRAPF